MRLSKDFLLTSLPHAAYEYGAANLLKSDAMWDVLEHKEEMAVSIDSRTLEKGDFFIALYGTQFDGHNFVHDAFVRGASGALVSKDGLERVRATLHDVLHEKLLIIVDDTLEAFVALAKAWRQKLQCPVVGITGSVGKTSTREMTKSICLAAGLRTSASIKTYNNIYGVCHTILRTQLSAEVVIAEVGINETGEMAVLADILRPTIGVITNIGHAHLEGLGNSLQNVSHEKRQLFSFFSDQNIGIIFGDQLLLTDIHYAHPVARFGFKTKNQVQARKMQVECDEQGVCSTTFTIKWYNKKSMVKMKGNHQGMIVNALAASTVAYFLNISLQSVIKGLETYQGFSSRFEVCKIKGGRGLLFNDCYNANPESMKAALVAFGNYSGQNKKVAVLGDMLELGQKEAFWHRQIGRIINKSVEIDHLILVGERARFISTTAPFDLSTEFATDWREALLKLERYLSSSPAAVLIKGSAGMKLGNIVEEIIE